MSLLPFSEDTDPFSFAGSVGRNGDNDRADVIKAQMLLSSMGEYDLPAPGVPTGWAGEPLFRAIGKVQKAKGLPVDGLLLPLRDGRVGENGEGETLMSLQDLLGERLRGRPIPTPQQVDSFFETYARDPDTPRPFFRTMEKRRDDPEPTLQTMEWRGPENARIQLLSADAAGEAPTTPPAPQRPIVNKSADRIRSILNDEAARFEIADNPDEDGAEPLWRIHNKGAKAVKDYGAIVEREAARIGVDPDLVKAVLYYENADGHNLILNDLGDWLGPSGTVMPMNINPKIWGGLGIPTREDARNPERNIQAGTLLLKRITDRLDDPTPAKIGAIWNGVGHEKVNHRGARIGRIYRERSWEKPMGPTHGR
jgi:hypothetical protein